MNNNNRTAEEARMEPAVAPALSATNTAGDAISSRIDEAEKQREIQRELVELQPHLQHLIGRKRRPGRPAGAKDARPRKKKAIVFRNADDQQKVKAARQHMATVESAAIAAQKAVEECERQVLEAQRKLADAQTAAEAANTAATASAATVADDLLLEPTHWNKTYKKLLAFKEREGHVNLKKHICNIQPTLASPDSQTDYKHLSRWCRTQRTAKRQTTLEPYQEVLLNRIGFDWDPRGGPGPEKWQRNYDKYCAFQRDHGGRPVTKDDDKELHRWTVAQATQLRNRKTGKYPCLSAERERLLNAVGFHWGSEQVVTPWETRFRELQKYKKQYGNCNVPWRWAPNRPLASWVNVQRNKYRDKSQGKQAAITDDQIRQLNEIGFRWSTEGKGRYIEDDDEDQASCSDSYVAAMQL